MRRTSCTMGGFCLLYLLMILLMRCGDVETNPGPDRIVSEEEFIKLSKLIEPSYYNKLSVNLDIPIAKLDQIKERSLNTSDALISVFTRWRVKQPPGTDIRAVLAEGLERSDLGSLSDELLAGSLGPKRTGAPVTMPGSRTQPLSPDLIKRCADDFKFKYRTTLCKIRADPLDPNSIVQLPDMYTNLVLEEEYRQHKRPLEYRDLFDLQVNGEFPKRIMVQGEAGTGKTTFCAKIAWDWINNSPVLPKFVWVLVVPFREAKQYTIGEIAKSYLSKDNPATACQITEYIRANPKDVFIAFDGLEEFDGKVALQRKSGLKSECHQPKPSSQASVTLQPKVNISEASGSSSERGEIALKDILCSEKLAACPVLVTSRPWKVSEIRWDGSLRKQYTFIHVEGFSKENVEVYIHKYFQDDRATADQLIRFTKDNVIISKNMAPYPLYISMLCLMWRVQEKSLQTFSQIFDEMFQFLKVHYAQKEITDLNSTSFPAYLSHIEKLMEPVAKVAFIGLQENTLIFKEGVFEQCSDSMETACRLGVLSQEKKLSSTYGKTSMFLQSTIFFPHKLIQEYMAGIHLASLYELDHNEFNRLIEQVVLPRKEEFRHLLYFTVSRDKTIANHVMKCMVQALQGNTTNPKEMDFLVDVAFESQDLDTAALVRRGGMSSLTINQSMTAHTIAGYIFTGLYKEVIYLSVYRGQFGPITSHDVAEIICSGPSLKHVALLQAALHSDFYVILAKEGNKSKVQTVMLEDVWCPTSASSHHLADALCSMPNLTDLRISGSDFQEEFYSTLYAKASTLQVQTVMLEDVRCPTSASSHNLIDALCSMPHLTDLKLSGKDFQEEFYSTLHAKASTLQITKLSIQDLNLKESDPTASRDLAKFLCLLPWLTDLMIRESNHLWLHDHFYHELALLASYSKIQNVCMEGWCLDNNDPMASRDLATFLCILPCLTNLTIKDSHETPSWFPEDFYREIALQGPSSKNFFFNKKLHFDERSEELRKMDVRQQREYIGHLLHPTLSEIAPRPTSKAHQGSVQHSVQKAGIVLESVQHSVQKAGIVADSDQNTTETSSRKLVSASQRPSASTSVDIPPQDASAAAGEVSMSNARVLSIDEQHEDEDKYHSEGIFDHTGGELHIPSYGLTLSIPPGALPEGSSETITVNVLTDIPPEITLKHDETLVTYGFQCLPSGLQFQSGKPVRLNIPHCANLIDPTKVQVVLYSLNHGGEAVRIEQTSRTCQVTYSHVEISLEHFTKVCAAFTKDLHSWKYKRMSFMPFLPKIMPESRKMLLEFRMADKPHGISWREVHDIRKNAEYRPAKDDDDEMNVENGDMEVTCQLKDYDILTENVNARDIDICIKNTVFFELDFNGKADDLLVKLKVIQSKLLKNIKFTTPFYASCGISEASPGETNSASPRLSESTLVDVPQRASAATRADSTFKARRTEESREGEFDDILKTVAKQFRRGIDIDDLGKELGFDPAEITCYIQTNEKYPTVTCMGTLSMLRDWRNKTTRSEERDKLKKVLVGLERYRLVDDHLNNDIARQSSSVNQSRQSKVIDVYAAYTSRQTYITYSRNDSNDGSPDEPSTKRDDNTNRNTDSNDEDERQRGDKQTQRRGSKDDSRGGHWRKRKKTHQNTDSNDEDKRTRGDEQIKRRGSKDDSRGGHRRKRKKTHRNTDSNDEDERTRGDKQIKRRSKDDSRGGHRRKRKKTHQNTDSNDEDERTRGNKQTKRRGSRDDSRGGYRRKRKEKTNQNTDSSDEDERPRGDKQTKRRGSRDDSRGGHRRKRKEKTNQNTNSDDEDERTRGNKKRKRRGFKDGSRGGHRRKRKNMTN